MAIDFLLLDRMLILSARHLESALSSYVMYYNGHRRIAHSVRHHPLGTVPPPTPAAQVQVQRHDQLGGLIHQYTQVA